MEAWVSLKKNHLCNNICIIIKLHCRIRPLLPLILSIKWYITELSNTNDANKEHKMWQKSLRVWPSLPTRIISKTENKLKVTQHSLNISQTKLAGYTEFIPLMELKNRQGWETPQHPQPSCHTTKVITNNRLTLHMPHTFAAHFFHPSIHLSHHHHCHH